MINNYSEQLFQSIDNIVSQRLNEVTFDKTEICTITAIDENYVGKYTVSNEAGLTYDAYATDEDQRYSENQRIYVTVPNGDYTQRKIIIGHYLGDEIPKNLYTNPFDHLVVSSKYHFINNEEENSLKAYAKRDKNTDVSTPYISNKINFYYSGLGQFNYIGLEFSAITDFGGTAGEFQIIIDLLDNDRNTLLTPQQLGLLTFSSKQLHGNPYNLNETLKFQHLFNFPVGNFSDLTKVKYVKIVLRTKGDFNYIGEEDKEVIIKDLTLFFGFDSSIDLMSKSKIQLDLDTPDSRLPEALNYTSASDKKVMSVKWIDTETNAIYSGSNDMQFPEVGKYYVYWLQYSESIGYTKYLETTKVTLDACWNSNKTTYKNKIKEKFENLETTDSVLFNKYVSLHSTNETAFKANTAALFIDIAESGTYWKTVQRVDASNQDAYTYTLNPCADWKKEQIKVIVKKQDDKDYSESNGLTFENLRFRSETGSNQGKKDTLRLTLASGDDGIYNNYGIDNKLLSNYNLEHSVEVDYIDNTEWNKDLQKVIWKIPKNATMIKQPEGWSEQDNFYVLEVNYNTTSTNGKVIKFNLSDQFSYNKTNNTIYCEIIRYKSKGSSVITDVYQGSITLYFGLQNTSGTKWAFNIVADKRSVSSYREIGEDDNSYQNKQTMFLTATLEDEKGNLIDVSNWGKNVEWTWYQSTKDADGNHIYDLIQNSNEKYKAEVNKKSGAIDYFAIVKATLKNWQNDNGEKVNLEAYLPIATGLPSYYLAGASRVIYNSSGLNPSYDTNRYQIFSEKYTMDDTATYEIYSPETNVNLLFQIDETTKILKPLSFIPTNPPKMCVLVKTQNGDTIYSQPILILQNGYQSNLLNEWNGSLEINTEKNSILSALVGAGVKNNNNTFTGVLMGAVGKEIGSAKTGIYGMSEGRERFSFTEKGSAYIGTGNNCYISFNENNSRSRSEELNIKAKRFNLETNRLLIDSDKGIQLKNSNDYTTINIQNNGSAVIGGWTFGSSYSSATFDSSNKNVTLFIGDGYGVKTYDSKGKANVDGGWRSRLGKILWGEEYNYTINGSCNCWGWADAGAGFMRKSNNNQLTYGSAINSILNNLDNKQKSKIKNIIIGGGYNDRHINTEEEIAELQDAINTINGIFSTSNYTQTRINIIFFAMGYHRSDSEIQKTIRTAYSNISKAFQNINKVQNNKCKWYLYDIYSLWNSYGKDTTGEETYPSDSGAKQIAEAMEIPFITTSSGYMYNDNGSSLFQLDNRPSSSWAIQIGMADADFTGVGGGSGYRRFLVSRSGELWATGAHIAGTINIDSSSTLNGTKVNKINNTTITSTPEKIALKAFTTSTDINGQTTTLGSFLKVQSDNISAKVSKTINDKDEESMSWDMSSSDFKIKVNNTTMLNVNKNGLTVHGAVQALSGYIGGWTIGASGSLETDGSLYCGQFGYDSSIYLIPRGSTEAVSIGGSESLSNWVFTAGSNFGVTKNGKLYATGADISGNITCDKLTANTAGYIGGWKISSNSISKGDFKLSSTTDIGNPVRLKAGSGFKIYNDGTIELSNGKGFLVFGPSSPAIHPYLSALNLNVRNGGMQFWDGETSIDTGANLGAIRFYILENNTKSMIIQTAKSGGAIYLDSAEICMPITHGDLTRYKIGQTGYTKEWFTRLQTHEAPGAKYRYTFHRSVFLRGIYIGQVNSAQSDEVSSYYDNIEDVKRECLKKMTNSSYDWYKNLKQI